jgi:hypothetical protein
MNVTAIAGSWSVTSPCPPLQPYKKTRLFFEFSLCLSRACLGKVIVLTIKWHRKVRVFSPPVCNPVCRCRSRYYRCQLWSTVSASRPTSSAINQKGAGGMH